MDGNSKWFVETDGTPFTPFTSQLSALKQIKAMTWDVCTDYHASRGEEDDLKIKLSHPEREPLARWNEWLENLFSTWQATTSALLDFVALSETRENAHT